MTSQKAKQLLETASAKLAGAEDIEYVTLAFAPDTRKKGGYTVVHNAASPLLQPMVAKLVKDTLQAARPPLLKTAACAAVPVVAPALTFTSTVSRKEYDAVRMQLLAAQQAAANLKAQLGAMEARKMKQKPLAPRTEDADDGWC